MSLETLSEFLNTVHYEQGVIEERLTTPEALTAFFREHDLHDPGVEARSAVVSADPFDQRCAHQP